MHLCHTSYYATPAILNKSSEARMFHLTEHVSLNPSSYIYIIPPSNTWWNRERLQGRGFKSNMVLWLRFLVFTQVVWVQLLIIGLLLSFNTTRPVIGWQVVGDGCYYLLGYYLPDIKATVYWTVLCLMWWCVSDTEDPQSTKLSPFLFTLYSTGLQHNSESHVL